MNIGLNTQLLSSQSGYRSAGIHGYIYNTLTHLADVAPDNWRFTAMVGANNQAQFNKIAMRHANLDTESPLKRIIWEQALQPFQLGNFDLYHASAFVSPIVLTKPSVVTVYDLSFIHYPQVLSTARRLYLRLFTALSCRRAERIIAISQSTADDVHHSLNIPKDKIDVAPCGYDQTRYHPLDEARITEFRQQQGLPERFWLFVGTLEPRKNLTTLLDAYAQLPQNERLPLVLGGGKGWLYADIFERVERYGLQDDVHFPGFIPFEELALWYNSAEVFLFPSVFEGFGLPVLEAMACGKPVIVSDASSLPEVAGQAGLCIAPHHVEAWTSALSQAYHDADWRESASQLSLQEAQHYSWQNTAQQTVKSYHRALKLTYENG